MNKRLILIISAVILGLALLAGLLFWAVKKQKQAPGPAAATLQLKKVLDEPIISPTPSFDNSAFWYFNSEGRLFRINTDGTGLTEFPMPTLSNNLRLVLWPKSGSDFLAITRSGNKEYKSYFDSAKKLYVNLPSNILYMDWLPDSKRIVYIWKSQEANRQSLVLANADGTGFKTITEVFWPDLIVKPSPDGKTILLYRSQPEGTVNKIYAADISTGAMTTVIESGKNLGAVWLPNSQKFIYAQNQGSTYSKLFLHDLATKASVDLNLNTNLDKILADKDGNFLYAAIPNPANSQDVFIKLDLNSLKPETYFSPEPNIRAKNLMLLGNTLYFINSRDGKLYTIAQ